MKRYFDNRTLALFSHVLVWLLLGITVFLLLAWGPRGTISFANVVKTGVHFLLLVVAFYINYLFLVEKYLLNDKSWRYICYVIMLLTGTMAVYLAINFWFLGPLQEQALLERSREVMGTLPPGLIQGSSIISTRVGVFVGFSILFVLAVGTSIKLGFHRLQIERQKEQVTKEKLYTELSFLKSQINPHFFFNMLNNIYSLIPSDPSRAQKTVHKLSKLMRYVLYESAREKVTFKREIGFINNYIELAKIRLPDSTNISFEHFEENKELTLPPLLFVPFLENIFKHGTHQNESSNIVISLKQSNNAIHFYSQNDIFETSSSDKNGNEGIGLRNVKRRLNLLYDNNYLLDISKEDQQFKVHLKIPVRDA